MLHPVVIPIAGSIMDKCVLFRRAFTDPENGCYRFLELRRHTRITAYLWILKRPRGISKVTIARWHSQQNGDGENARPAFHGKP